MQYIKAPMNYIGNKYRILQQIQKWFPRKIDLMVDIFCGGCDVTFNTKANEHIANDLNFFVIEIYKEFQQLGIEKAVEQIDRTICNWKLTKENKEAYEHFRAYYNRTKNPIDLYVLMCYSFNYQFRFNAAHEYNNPFEGQKFIAEKTNEIPAAQEILRMMDLEGTIVTADAMNCQKGTAEAVINAGGDYVLALKGNQQLFHEEVKEYFDTDVCESLRGETGHYMKTTDKEHGGMAVREYYITEDIMWFSEKEKWEGLKSIGMVHKVMKKNNGEQTEEDRYYICSIGAEAEEFERAARGHWGIENGLHWQLDFTFGDDKNTSMAKTSAKNLQTMKKIALSILRLVRDSYKISMKRIRYDLSLDFENGIEKMLSLLDINSVKSLIESNGKSSGKK